MTTARFAADEWLEVNVRAYMVEHTVLAIKFLDAACICFPKRTLVELAVSGCKLEQDVIRRLALVCAFPACIQDVKKGASEVYLGIKRKVVAHQSVVCFREGGWAVRGHIHLLSSL